MRKLTLKPIRGSLCTNQVVNQLLWSGVLKRQKNIAFPGSYPPTMISPVENFLPFLSNY
jgi:hypothetical protein